MSFVKCGVPQGSVLGPILFLIYVNDINFSVPDAKIKLFADDTNMFKTGKEVNELFLKCNIHLDKLNEWLLANKLTLNANKTCYNFFDQRHIIISMMK